MSIIAVKFMNLRNSVAPNAWRPIQRGMSGAAAGHEYTPNK